MGEVTHCGVCGHAGLLPVLDLGLQPLAERMDEDAQRYPLALARCGNCSLVQLDYIVDPREVFPVDHPYSTGNTGALREHFTRLAAEVNVMAGDGELVVDIGANDGTFLERLRPELRRFGVEPTNQVRKAVAKGLAVYQGFFTRQLADEISNWYGTASVVTACNVLAHVPDPNDFVAGVAYLLADDGVFITENHDLAAVTDGLQLDTIYHEHLRYYSLASLSYLLERHGLTVRQTENLSTHGGSVRVYARRQCANVSARAGKAARGLHDMLSDLTCGGTLGAVYGVGAATRATPLIHYAAIERYISVVCEVSGSDKIGHRMPGTVIPVVDEKRLIEDQPAYALLFAWHLAEYIIPSLRRAGYQGKFILPLPEPKVVTDDF